MAQQLQPGPAPDPEAFAAPENPVWPHWTRLTRIFPVWSIGLTSLRSRGAARFGGVDFIGVLRWNRTTDRALALTSGLPEDEFDALTALAALNARRQERLFRGVLVLYATLPITLLATSGELVPEFLLAFFREEWRLMAVYALLFTFVLVWYYASLWRARQLVDVLDIARIERRIRPYTAVELRES